MGEARERYLEVQQQLDAATPTTYPSSEAKERAEAVVEAAKFRMLEAEKTSTAMKARATAVADTFYNERGVDLISVEVLQFKCSNPQTDKTLQEIIKETADRLKKKECQKGENEVALSKLEGEIEQERLNKQLIELKKSHLKTESRIEGEAEYHKVAAFLGGCTGEGADEVTVPMDQAVQLYQMLRKLDSVQALADSSSTLYVTPDDVNLTVGQLYPAPKPNK